MSAENNQQFEIALGEVEVGGKYPLYAMITKIIDDTPGSVVVELNFNIEARLNVPEQSKVDLLKERSFELAIFVSNVIQKEPKIVVECATIIFGRKRNGELQ